MTELSRSARLAAWASAWLAGSAALDDVLDHVHGCDEPHRASGVPGSPAESGLASALGAMRARGVRSLRLALPAPGDPLGLPGPAALTEAALAAGEAVVAVDGGCALVPEVTAFGPPGDQGHLVRWHWHAAAPGTPAVPSLAEADRALQEALLEAAATMTALDVAAWRPAAAGLVARTVSSRALPDAFPARAESLVARADRLDRVLRVAFADDGGALNGREAQARRQALVPLDRAVRRAVVAACAALAETAGVSTRAAAGPASFAPSRRDRRF